MPQRVMIIAGEASGDMHACELVRQVHRKESDVEFYGIGGDNMRAAGVETLVDASELAVVGLIEVIAHRKIIFAALHKMQSLLQSKRPDLLILVDYAEFNLKLAKTAKDLGVKVLFYISPQVWAWRQKRVYKIKQRVDMMAVIFPFEADFYREYDVPVEYVGHPLIGKVTASSTRDEFLLANKLKSEHTVVGIFPGSRKSEIKRLLPILIKSAHLVHLHDKSIQFVLPVAATLDVTLILPYIDNCPFPVKIIKGNTYDVINACDTIMTVSGTVTLEIALMHTPFVIINKLSWLSYFLVKRMIKITYIGLCNIVMNREVAKEFIQSQASPANIAKEIIKLIDNREYYNTQKSNLQKVEGKLTDKEITMKVGDVVLTMLNND